MSTTPPLGPFIRKAAILAIGSELLTPWRLDTNSLFLTDRLNDLGIEIVMKAVAGDEAGEIGALLVQAMQRADLVVLTGGLGPTADDLTREVTAERLGLPLEEDPAIVARLRARFEARGWRMPEINRRQAMVPRGARVLENPNGTAPGLWIEHGRSVVVLLPGPPRELQPMVERLVEGRLAERVGTERLYRRLLRIAGRGESHVEELAHPIYSPWQLEQPPILTTILASPGQVELHLVLRSAAPDQARVRLDTAVKALHEALGRDVFTTEGKLLEEAVGERLRARGHRVAVAESCTGGLVVSRLTDVPGSSDYVGHGVIAYSNAAKIALLGVPSATIDAHGAVSEAVALAMAAGARTVSGAEWGVGVTGIAGPGGGTEAKPVGTVAIAVVGPADLVRTRTFRLPGDRLMVKTQSAQLALDMLRRAIEDAGSVAVRGAG